MPAGGPGTFPTTRGHEPPGPQASSARPLASASRTETIADVSWMVLSASVGKPTEAQPSSKKGQKGRASE